MSDFIILNTQTPKVDRSNTIYELNQSWFLLTNDAHKVYKNKSKKIIVFGDYIGSEQELLATPINEIPRLRGNFYAIVVLKNTLYVYSSFLNMLPLYSSTDESMVGSSIRLLLENGSQEFSLDKKYILENLLFNYGFFNRTKYEQLKLVPSNNFVSMESAKVVIRPHYSINELFVKKKRQKTSSAHAISDLFIETVKHYLPEDSFDIAFTSGFDGRTLVSCALYYQKNFSTFSFGRIENDDVSIPMKNAKELGIPYEYLDLNNNEYLEVDFIKNALEYSETGYFGNGFLYAHFPYSAKKVNSRSKYILSGACGSELFRALHSPGAVTSSALVAVFKSQNEYELREKINSSKTLRVLNKEEFEIELEELIDEIIAYKRQLPKEISINQQFYIFVFEEIFRKFFGQWLVVQQKHIQVRTPYLDFKFVQRLLESDFAGANNDFLTSNPFKRVKGQYIYADIIKKTNRKIYGQKTGKGYRPIDVRNPFYMGKVVLPFLKKKVSKKVSKPFLDNLGIVSGVKKNQVFLKELISTSLFFNHEMLNKMLEELSAYTPENDRDTLLMSICLINNLRVKMKIEEQELTII